MTSASDPRSARIERNYWWIFAVIGAGSFLGPLSGSITTVALPAIAQGFGVDVQSAKWVVLSYLMVSTILVPVAGKLGQRFGESRVYATGFAIYAVSSAACALSAAGSLNTLVIARAVQSCGSALLFAVGSALVTRYVPPPRRGLAFGLIGSIVGVALIAGPVLGGIIAGKLGWPWIFWLLVPVSITGLILSITLLPHIPGGPSDAPAFSALTWAVIVIGLTLTGEAFSKGLWLNYLPLTLGVTSLALLGFIISERRGQALFDYTLFKIQAYRIGAITAIMINSAVFAMYVFVPFYLEDYRHLDPIHVGMILGLSPLIGILVGPASGHLADRFGFRRLIIGGVVLMALGYGLLGLAVRSGGPLWHIAIGMGVMGLGSSLFAGPNYAAMMSSVGPHQRSLASSFGSLTRNLGFLIGTSLGAVIFGLLLWRFGGRELMVAARTEELVGVVHPEAFVFAFGWLLLGCAFLAALSALVSLRFPDRIEHQA